MKKTAYFSAVRIIAFLGALVLIPLLLFSLSGPRSSWQQKTIYDNSILFVFDLSYSMNAQDIQQSENDEKISRLEAAKQVIQQIVEAGGEAIYGLVVFSEVAHRLIPLTADTGIFLEYTKNVNTGLLPGGGTDWNSLEKIFSGNVIKYAKIIFLSDADISERYKIQSTTFLGSPKKYFIAIGSEEGEYPRLPNGTIMKSKGEKIISRLGVQAAAVISKALGAKLFHIENTNGLEDIVSQIIRSSKVFSYNQVQILVVLLGIFILLVL